MRTAPFIQDTWNQGGPFIGATQANTVVTIQYPFTGDIIHAVNAGNYGPRGEPVRWYQSLANDQTEIIVPNVKTVTIDRSIDQDAGTCEIVMFNQWMHDNGDAPDDSFTLGQPGYFTFNRGQSRDALARWNSPENEWKDAFLPNALLRTYQGYGGHEKNVDQAVADGNLLLTGVWLIDTVTISTSGTLSIKARDMAKLLIEQQLYLPLIPADHYPLKYFRWSYIDDNVRAGVRVVGTNSNANNVAISYSDSSSDRWYGYNADIHGHHPTDSLDGSEDTYWLGVGNSYTDAPWATDWIEYNVGAAIDGFTMSTWQSNYIMYASVMVNGEWLGGNTIPYDPSYLFVSQDPAVDTGANIPFVAQYGVGDESETFYALPQIYQADKIRISFRQLQYSFFGPWYYRTGVRQFAASVGGGGGGTSAVTYQPFFIAADAAADGVGYITVDSFGDVDVFGDARRFDYSGGAALDANGGITGGATCVVMTSTGLGYYILTLGGKVYCYGDAAYHGDPNATFGYTNENGVTGDCFELIVTPSHNGYWVIDTAGFLYPFGDATAYGHLPFVPANGGLQYSGADGTHGSQGLVIVRSDGVVLTLGAAVNYGQWNTNVGVPLSGTNFCGDIRYDDAGTGYWIMSQAGDVQAFGTAAPHVPIFQAADSADWHDKYWQMMPQVDGGYELLQGNGTIVAVGTQYWFGSPVPGGVAQLRVNGNYLDYSDIIKDLALWSGFYLYDPALPANATPEVYGNIESTGAYAPEALPDTLFDKKPVIDAMHQLKETVGYILYIDDQGGFRFESPNWWGPGNFDELGNHLEYLPEVDEQMQLIDYSVSISDQDQRSVIIISSEDPDQHFTSTITTTFVPTNSQLRGLIKPAMWVNGFFQSPVEQKTMAELISLHIHFQARIGSVSCVANPAIGINDQVRIWERQTGESYVHYVRGVRTTHDLQSGTYLMSLTTHWLGDETEWAIANDDTGAGFQLSSTTREVVSASPALATQRLIPLPVTTQPTQPPPTTTEVGAGDNPPPTTTSGPSPTIERLIYLQQSPYEAIPHGVPADYSWYDSPTFFTPSPGAYGAAIAWGQIYLAVGHSLPANTRVQVRDMNLYGFNTSTHTWTHMQSSSNIEGALYVEDFAGNVNIPDGHRNEPDGGISVVLVPDHNFHFYIKQYPRPVLPSTITQFVSTYQARLILNDPAGPDNRSSHSLIANAGADLYYQTTGGTPPIDGAGQGRFAFLDGNWQVYSMSTVSSSNLITYPPPL